MGRETAQRMNYDAFRLTEEAEFMDWKHRNAELFDRDGNRIGPSMYYWLSVNGGEDYWIVRRDEVGPYTIQTTWRGELYDTEVLGPGEWEHQPQFRAVTREPGDQAALEAHAKVVDILREWVRENGL